MKVVDSRIRGCHVGGVQKSSIRVVKPRENCWQGFNDFVFNLDGFAREFGDRKGNDNDNDNDNGPPREQISHGAGERRKPSEKRYLSAVPQ